VLGLATTDAECGAQDPETQCFPEDALSNATSVSGTVSNGSYSGSSSADLATGELKIKTTGPTYQALASAELMDQLTFTNITPGTSQTIGIILNVDGTYRDGSTVSFDAGFNSGGYGTADYDYLSMNLGLMGNGEATNPNDPVSGSTFNLGDACTFCYSASSGDWSVFGPTQFIGEVDIFGNNPVLTITMGISGTGNFDLSNTSRISLVLPEGVSFTSSSGVFLPEVPVPGAIWIFGSGVIGLVGIYRRKKSASQFQI
jgi:hypothetical protein